MSEPIRVVSEPPTLDLNASGYLISAVFSIALRTLIAWAVIAILIPQFGITFWMVYLIIVGINAIRGPGAYDLIHASNRAARRTLSNRQKSRVRGGSDNALLIARSKA